MAWSDKNGQGRRRVILEALLLRAVSVLAVLAVSLCACKAPPSKGEQAAASSASPATSSAPATSAAAAPAPDHNWAYRQGDQYAYASQTGEDRPTMIRFLGAQDGVYTIIESQDGAIVAASCAKPCDTVRLRGKGLDQTLALSPTSVIHAALMDAMNGQLEVYSMPAAAGRKAPQP